MFEIAFTLGIIGIMFVLYFLGREIHDEHWYLKVACYGVIILLALVLSGYYMTYQTCEWKLNETTEVYTFGNDFNTSNWDGTGTDLLDLSLAYPFSKNVTNNYQEYCRAENGVATEGLYKIWLVFIKIALAGVIIAPLFFFAKTKYDKYKQKK